MPNLSYVDIVFEKLPGHDNPRFIEVEDADGRSFQLGRWVQRPDGTCALRFSIDDLQSSL